MNLDVILPQDQNKKTLWEKFYQFKDREGTVHLNQVTVTAGSGESKTIYVPTRGTFYAVCGGPNQGWGAEMYWLGERIAELWYKDGSLRADGTTIDAFISQNVKNFTVPGKHKIYDLGSIIVFFDKYCSGIASKLQPPPRGTADQKTEKLDTTPTLATCLCRSDEYEQYFKKNEVTENDITYYMINRIAFPGVAGGYVYFPSARTVLSGRGLLNPAANSWMWTLDTLLTGEGYDVATTSGVALPQKKELKTFLKKIEFDKPVKIAPNGQDEGFKNTTSLEQRFANDIRMLDKLPLTQAGSQKIKQDKSLSYNEETMKRYVDKIKSGKITAYKSDEDAKNIFMCMLKILVNKRKAKNNIQTYDYIARILSTSSLGFWERMTTIW